MPALVLGAYRSDGLPRDHGMRRLRHELRRRGRLAELAVGPPRPRRDRRPRRHRPGRPAVPGARADAPRPRAGRAVLHRGARAGAQRVGRRWSPVRRAWRWAGRGRSPSRRRCATPCCSPPSELSQEGRAAADAAAVAGTTLRPGARGRRWRAPTAWPSWSSGAGSARTATAAARSGTRSPARRSTPTSRGCAAARCTGSSPRRSRPPPPRPWRSPPTGWAPASPPARATALLRAAEELRAVHAHRDAARAWRQALELWPEGEDVEERLAVLAAYARSAELAGEPTEAARAWREVCDLLGESRQGERAEALRRLAAVHDLRGDRESALAARRAAAEAFAAADPPRRGRDGAPRRRQLPPGEGRVHARHRPRAAPPPPPPARPAGPSGGPRARPGGRRHGEARRPRGGARHRPRGDWRSPWRRSRPPPPPSSTSA